MRRCVTLLVVFAAACPAAAAPPEPVSTVTVEPTAIQRIEREIREALPVGTSAAETDRWLRGKGAIHSYTTVRSMIMLVFGYDVPPGRNGLAVPNAKISIRLLHDPAFGLQRITVRVCE